MNGDGTHRRLSMGSSPRPSSKSPALMPSLNHVLAGAMSPVAAADVSFRRVSVGDVDDGITCNKLPGSPITTGRGDKKPNRRLSSLGTEVTASVRGAQRVVTGTDNGSTLPPIPPMSLLRRATTVTTNACMYGPCR